MSGKLKKAVRHPSLIFRRFAPDLEPSRQRLVTAVGRSSAGSELYYRITSQVFGREFRAVAAGIRAFNRSEAGPYFTVRRNTHMLEKGLIMQPRRPVFALDYIGETVDALVQLSTSGRLGLDEQRWPHDVLAAYFVAVDDEPSGVVADARKKFLAYEEAYESANSVREAPRSHSELEQTSIDIDQLEQLARRRRSVRWFTDRPVPEHVIDRALRVGSTAPSACNRQPYRFIVATDPDVVKELALLPMGTRGYNHQIPGLVITVGDLSAYFSERDRHLIYTDSSLAIMQAVLAFEVQGVSTCCINWPDIKGREQAAAKALNLAPHERIIMFLAFGYADPDGGVPYSAKRPLDLVRSYRDPL